MDKPKLTGFRCAAAGMGECQRRAIPTRRRFATPGMDFPAWVLGWTSGNCYEAQLRLSSFWLPGEYGEFFFIVIYMRPIETLIF